MKKPHKLLNNKVLLNNKNKLKKKDNQEEEDQEKVNNDHKKYVSIIANKFHLVKSLFFIYFIFYKNK